ncbi:MAG: hypothetical protein U0903_00675 [Planctomycetales bacterium]
MLTWIQTIALLWKKPSPRRRVRARLSSVPVEVCEERAYLNGTFPISGLGDVLADPGAPVATTADYTGDWKGSFDDLKLTYANGKVTGEYSGLNIVGQARVKGKAEELQMTATIRGRGLSPIYGLGKFKISMNVTLTDQHHFEGTTQVLFAGHDLGGHHVQFRKP